MLINSLPEKLNADELLLRAVLPFPRFWNNGQLSSAALKDSRGLSVDRTYDRTLEESICFMRKNLRGDIVTITQDICRAVEAVIVYRPTENIYHCEIHGSKDQKVLSTQQAKELALSATVVYRATIQTT